MFRQHRNPHSKSVFVLCSALALTALACGGSSTGGTPTVAGSRAAVCSALVAADAADPVAEAMRDRGGWDCGSLTAEARQAVEQGAVVEVLRAETVEITDASGQLRKHLKLDLEVSLRADHEGGPCLRACTPPGELADR